MSSERVLDRIQAPCDVKALSDAELDQLSSEIRDELVSTVAKTGGHLAPNLGVVELTLGIHRALDCPTDKVIWDVGHQSYVHKLITGRRDRFETLRQYGGMCGFTKRVESPFDVYDTGHASDSLSVALGLAEARDALGRNETIVAVIGDGSMTGGMAFEALNHIGHLGTRLVVMLNDNEMSIAPNVGALAGYLARVRLDPRYNRLRDGVESRLAQTRFGAALVGAGEAVKGSVKQLLVPGMLFEELGLKYVGPIDGHSVAEVQAAVEGAMQFNGPVLVHAITHKGAGYSFAEEQPDAFHGIAPFEVSTGKTNGSSKYPSFTSVFAKALIKEAEAEPRICAITAAMPSGTGLDAFAEQFPERFFDVGIAEEHAVGLASGLALGGMLPVVAIYSTFLQRAYDQLIMDTALQNVHVVFCLDRAGLVGEDGPTHHGVFDLTYLRSIPNMMVLAPADEAELVEALHTALQADGPVAVRYPRGSGTGHPIPEEPSVWEAGKAQWCRRGTDVALMAVGRMVGVAEGAADLLAEDGVSASVINARWVKPIDLEMLAEVARGHKLITTVEENTGLGGYGSAILEGLSDLGIDDVAVLRLAIPDCFVTHGAMELLLEEVGLTPEGVRGAVLGRIIDISSPSEQADDAPTRRRGAR